ncbi:MAG: PEP-CTERM sorting domain-containing protein [Verrucomicrobiota bacterium]
MKKLIVTLMVFAMAGSVLAASYHWKNEPTGGAGYGNGDGLYETAGNWSINASSEIPATVLPGSGDTIIFGGGTAWDDESGASTLSSTQTVLKIALYHGQLDIPVGAQLNTTLAVTSAHDIGRGLTGIAGNTTINIAGEIKGTGIMRLGTTGGFGTINVTGNGLLDTSRIDMLETGGGLIAIEDNASMTLSYNNDVVIQIDGQTDADIILRDNATIVMRGDRLTAMAALLNDEILTDDTGKTLQVAWDDPDLDLVGYTTISIIPEPATIGLFGMAGLGTLMLRRLRK